MQPKANKKKSQWKDVWLRLKRNKAAMLGLIILLLLVFCAIFSKWLAPYGYDEQELSRRFTPPLTNGFILGTDQFGRDILSRLIYGSRYSLLVGAISVTVSAIAGSAIGAVAGFYGGKIDNVFMRFIDILMAIPSTLLAIAIAAALGSGLMNVIIAVGIGSIPGYARIVRAQVLTVKEQEFIEAARMSGSGDAHIIIKHILPNCLAPIIVQATLGVASAILTAAALSFLGLGIQPPAPEWGAMLSQARQYIRGYWYVVTFPGLAIMITIFALNLFGDGLRDALDPRLKN